MKKISFFIIWMYAVSLSGQNTSFSIQLQPFSIEGLGGLQSYAWAQSNAKWLVVGGRKDGLHRRQPFAAFDAAGQNDQLIVIDPVNMKFWSRSLSELPIGLRDPLKATNMQFYQDDDLLFLFGGYGYSEEEKRHTTYPTMTILNVPALINAVVQNSPILPHISQWKDNRIQVTGGDIKKIGQNFYLIGGHKFVGSYNPMGPTHGPGFEQEYTNSVRIFQLVLKNQQYQIDSFRVWQEEKYFHRRDLNVVPHISPSGREGITAFSGVFQPSADLPYLDCVHINENGYFGQPDFLQYFNHYHCATIPLFDSENEEMSTLFFGGMAQYSMQGGQKVKDDNVPFVKTVSKVTILANGQMKERVLPVEMPGYMGAGSHFIPVENLALYPNGVIRYDSLAEVQLLGFIYGGISSTAANIFFTNDGTQSRAIDNLFLVTLHKEKSSSTEFSGSFLQQVTIRPNPAKEGFSVQFPRDLVQDISWQLIRTNGSKVLSGIFGFLDRQENVHTITFREEMVSGIYYLILSDGKEQSSIPVIIK